MTLVDPFSKLLLKPYFYSNTSQVIFRSLQVLEGGLKKAQENPNIFILFENNHETRNILPESLKTCRCLLAPSNT